MTLHWRRLLLCLLVLALPVQGFAATLRLACAAAQSVDASVAAPCHETMQAAPADEPADDEAGPASSHKCSACAACHAQLALDSPAVPPNLTTEPAVYTEALRPWPAGRLVDALERPPRSLLA